MYGPFSRLVRTFLVLWLGVFFCAAAAHTPSGSEAALEYFASLGVGHEPWHLHVVQANSGSWQPSLESCTLCLAQGNLRALPASVLAVHPAAKTSASIVRLTAVGRPHQPSRRHPSRAPPDR